MSSAVRKARSDRPPGVVRTEPLSVRLPEYFDGSGRAFDPIARAERDFGSGQPMPPTEGRGSQPRAIVPPTYANLSAHPRRWPGVDLTPFAALRNLGDFDLCQVAIGDVKGQLLGMQWDVAPLAEVDGEAKAVVEQIALAKQFVRVPDPLHCLEFRRWCSRVIEEVLITDALSLYPRFSKGGAHLGLEQIDGATIVPLVDDMGRPPLPPAAAYVQKVHGRNETEFLQPIGEPSPLELWYMPSNPRVDTPYGRSAVERVIYTVNLAIRGQIDDLNYHTAGNMPDSLYSIPGWNRSQIAEYQEYFDTLLEGRPDKRAGSLRFVPEGTYSATKTREWKYEFQEWLGRVIAWAFGVSPIPITRVMNRATADQLESSSLESGVRPLADFIATIINRYLFRVLGCVDVEFVWGSDETEDAVTVYQRNVAHLNSGIRTLNELRDEVGGDRYPAEYGDRPFVMTAAGPLFFDTIEEERKRKIDQSEAFKSRLAGDTEEKPHIPVKGGAEAGAEGDAPGTGQEGSDAVEKIRGHYRAYANTRRVDVANWRKRLLKGRTRHFTSVAIGPSLRELVGSGAIDAALTKAAELKFSDDQVDVETRLRAAIASWLVAQLPAVTDWAVAKLGPVLKLAKLDAPPINPGGLFDSIAAILSDAHALGGSDTAGLIGIDFDTAPAQALQFAQERAAELVGKKWIAGQLVDNPNAKFAITDTLRAAVNDTVAKAVAEGWSPQELTSALGTDFGPWRAETIARTETAFAYNAGAADVYEASEVDYVLVQDGEGCLPDGHVKGAPKATGTVGVVELANEADGQVWTIAQMRQYPVGHPNCVRGFPPYFPEVTS